MANAKNLKPVRSVSEARKKGRKGGVASGKKRRELKAFKDLLEAGLRQEIKTESGKSYTRAEYIALKLIKNAENGNIKAFEVVRDTIGQKPADKVESKTEISVGKDLSKLSTETLIKMAKAAAVDIEDEV
ncbi:MAG: hypothetical protein ACI352_01280 [Elusimicrobiaceae bacterium]